MPENEPMQTAKDGIAAVGELIRLAADAPQAKEAATNLGQAAVTLTRTINNALLPLAAINFAFEKARNYFSGRFQEDLASKSAGIPPEAMIEPKPSIAGPTLQGLAFAHEEQGLKDMYLNLLATAMDKRVAPNAHPAFVEIIKQLDSEDADLVRGTLQSPVAIPIVQVRIQTTGVQGFRVLATHILDLRAGANRTVAVENPRLPALVDNWCRLGLVEVDYDQHLTDERAYSWVEERPEVVRLRASHETETEKINPKRGVLVRTQLGIRFATAVGLL